ncbi:GNAT family N-acetyltransferase [Paracoccus sp. S1E-3]|uniref:GNAT family N-acetyltransferase n=1 Tax=Paracoccus sp. S1E-3 TaxID=2756130 RepID=UPI001C68AB3B|nr:N-acetyltransferase [Paracoccus sp. S1E-3]
MSDAAPTLRPARPQDAGACAEIPNGWIDATPWMPRIHSAEAVRQRYREVVIPRRNVLVATHGGAVAGFLAIDEAEITSFYMRLPGRRIGAALLGAAKTGRMRLSLWTFQANRGARRFYLREGFREVARTAGENEEGLPDVQYLWEGTP